MGAGYINGGAGEERRIELEQSYKKGFEAGRAKERERIIRMMNNNLMAVLPIMKENMEDERFINAYKDMTRQAIKAIETKQTED